VTLTHCTGSPYRTKRGVIVDITPKGFVKVEYYKENNKRYIIYFYESGRVYRDVNWSGYIQYKEEV
jgi:hypothetical protein